MSATASAGGPRSSPSIPPSDAQESLAQFIGIPYEKWITPVPGIRARYWNAGHLLGSASIEVEVEQARKAAVARAVFRRYRARSQAAAARSDAPPGFDYVICESTYGGTDRFERDETQAPRNSGQ